MDRLNKSTQGSFVKRNLPFFSSVLRSIFPAEIKETKIIKSNLAADNLNDTGLAVTFSKEKKGPKSVDKIFLFLASN